MQVRLRRAHVRVPGTGHQGDRCLTGRGTVRQGGVPEVVERLHAIGDASSACAKL
jgi:hypothetical protein